MKSKTNKTVAISLFSGCGGLDLGSHWAGVPVIAAIDKDSDSVETLKANNAFKDSEVFNGDIREFKPAIFKKIINKYSPHKFILLGGPPCQPFSKAGYWIGNNARKKDKDPRNLINEYFDYVKYLQPDGFVFENVESLFHPTNKHVIEEIVQKISKLNYKFKIIRTNALDYGVPQRRKRIFILGSKHKFNGDPDPTHAPFEMANLLGLKPYVTSREAIEHFDSDEYFEPEEITSKGTYSQELAMVPAGKNYIALTKAPLGPHPTFQSGKRFWSFLLKLSPDEPSWTIAAQPGPWVGPFHWTSRRLRVPEIAALQTFPLDYIFTGSRRSIQRQIGNAVPPLLGQRMVEFLIENI